MGSAMFCTRTRPRRRGRNSAPSRLRVSLVKRRRALKYLAAPWTRLATFTVSPRGPYLDLRTEPVLPNRANLARDGQLDLAVLPRHHDLRLTQAAAGREVGHGTEIGELDPPVRNCRDSGVLPRHSLLIVPGDHQPPCARLQFRDLVEIRFRTRGRS